MRINNNIAAEVNFEFAALTPKKVFKAAETHLTRIQKCLKAVQKAISTLNASVLLAGLSKLPSRITNLSKGLGLFGVFLLPFDTAKFGAKVQKALDAEDFGSFTRAALEAIAQVKSILEKVIAPLKTLHSLKIIEAAPYIPFLNLLSLPSSLISNGLALYDLVGSIRRFTVIKGNCKNFSTTDEALEALEALKTHDIKKIHKQLELGKEVDLAARVNALQTRLQEGDESAVEDVAEFYQKLKNRATTTLALECTTKALNIASLAVQIFSMIPTPVNPLIAAVAGGAISLASFGVWSGKELFLSKDIFTTPVEA